MMTQPRGSIFLSTMVSLFVMTLIGGFIYQMSTQDLQLVNRMRKAAQAQHLAEAGLAKAFAVLKNDFNSKNNAANFPLTNLGEGTYDASITQAGNRVLVSCVGDVQGVKKTVSAEVLPPQPSALDYATAGSSLSFTLAGQSSITVSGKIYADTNISLNAQAGNSSIAITNPGNADAGGNITTSGNGSIVIGPQTPGSNLAGFPVVDFAFYKNIAQNQGGVYINGNQTYNTANSMPSPGGRVIFVEGNLTISASQNTTAAIFATGSITMTAGSIAVNQPSNYPAMVTQNQPISINSSGNPGVTLSTAGVIYSGNDFSITGNHNTIDIENGSILARGALTGNSGGFSHNDLDISISFQAPNLVGISDTGERAMRVRSYNA